MSVSVHIHDWQLNGSKWRCQAPDHIHPDPYVLDAATAWHVLGVIKTHQIDLIASAIDWTCECGWTGDDYYEHLDDAIFYWLRDIEPAI